MDLNMMLKRRSKLAGKAITNLMFPHHHGGSTSSRRNNDTTQKFSTTREYEFSCSNTPNYIFALNNNKRNRHNNFFACAHAPHTLEEETVAVNVVKVVLENMVNNREVMVEASPALPGFGRTPNVRQLRVTDSPFPLHDTDTEAEVDKAAEAFIKRFYTQLRKQD